MARYTRRERWLDNQGGREGGMVRYTGRDGLSGTYTK